VAEVLGLDGRPDAEAEPDAEQPSAEAEETPA
jgi:hypothetical protein